MRLPQGADFWEKPLAKTVADCDGMIAAARGARVALGVGHALRYMPLFQQAQKIGAEHAAGAFRTGGGGVASLSLNWSSPLSLAHGYLACERGALHYDRRAGRLDSAADAESPETVQVEASEVNNPCGRELGAFSDWVRKDIPPLVTAERRARGRGPGRGRLAVARDRRGGRSGELT